MLKGLTNEFWQVFKLAWRGCSTLQSLACVACHVLDKSLLLPNSGRGLSCSTLQGLLLVRGCWWRWGHWVVNPGDSPFLCPQSWFYWTVLTNRSLNLEKISNLPVESPPPTTVQEVMGECCWGFKLEVLDWLNLTVVHCRPAISWCWKYRSNQCWAAYRIPGQQVQKDKCCCGPRCCGAVKPVRCHPPWHFCHAWIAHFEYCLDFRAASFTLASIVDQASIHWEIPLHKWVTKASCSLLDIYYVNNETSIWNKELQ